MYGSADQLKGSCATFFAWWVDELKKCLPETWVRRQVESELYWAESGVDAARSIVEGSHDDSCLILPGQFALVRTIYLPAMTEKEISSALVYEMDKYVPFTSGQVYFDFVRTSFKQGEYSIIELVVVARQKLDAVLEVVGGQGYNVACVDVSDGEGKRIGVDILSIELRGRKNGSVIRKINGALLVAMVILGLASMSLYVQNKKIALEAMQTQVDALRHEAAGIEDVRQRFRRSIAEGERLLTYKAHALSAILFLDELARCMPSDTWLDQLEVGEDGTINMQGQTASPSALLTAIKECSSVSNAQFQGGIQPDEATGKSNFSMSAQLRPRGVHALSLSSE
ncbi:PilN domain-containing protein [Phytopseudomonas daroniae]|uniref:PilN domain-containing protein n=1 Tax=Phytopseudomonas daroniae TaxID=2487519 RepID=UPI0013F17835|nr:PilN domain-containing protein [Pseudomonas daroniae]